MKFVFYPASQESDTIPIQVGYDEQEEKKDKDSKAIRKICTHISGVEIIDSRSQ